MIKFQEDAKASDTSRGTSSSYPALSKSFVVADVLKAFPGQVQRVQSIRVVQLSEVADLTSSLKWNISGFWMKSSLSLIACFSGHNELNELFRPSYNDTVPASDFISFHFKKGCSHPSNGSIVIITL